MIGIVVVTHGKLAEALIAVTEHVVGKQAHMVAVGIEPDDDAENARARILEALKTVDQGKGVIMLTDMFGGTPSNLAISVMHPPEVEVVAGVNLPMMIKLASIRSQLPIEEAVNQAQDSGRKYINVAGAFLTPK